MIETDTQEIIQEILDEYTSVFKSPKYKHKKLTHSDQVPDELEMYRQQELIWKGQKMKLRHMLTM